MPRSLFPQPRWLLGLCALIVPAAVSAEAPLHQRIDQLIGARNPSFQSQAAPLSDDAEFLRRVTLDLTGTIPTSAEARAFLLDRSADKRARLIDKLLASPEYARRMAEVFDVLLMERRQDANVPRAQWHEFLRSSFEANKPWDQLVREILSSDGADPKTRPAARFYLDREADPVQLTRDISRLFLGTNLRCAQCHDHPLVEDYKQAHFYGIYAFLNRTYLFREKNRQALMAEKADGDVSFQSVFDPTKATKTTGPRLPGKSPIAEPKLEKGKEYAVAPGKGVRPVPKFSRRGLLAAQLASPDNPQFRRTIANQLWALLMGRGLVHPLDLDHTANPPSHPQVLNALADELSGHKFDLKHVLREMALSTTYQRSSARPENGSDVPPETFAVALLKPLTPEQLAWSTMQASGLTDAERQALGKKANERTLHARLAGNLAAFVNTFGSAPGQPEGQSFEATLDQTLFVCNGNLIRSWLAPRAGNLTDRLAKLQDANTAADELYLSVLTRLPDDLERKEVAGFLQGRSKDRLAALQELGWALLASAEARFNH